jgi:hypothetical protein
MAAGGRTQARPVCPHLARRVYNTDIRNLLAYDDHQHLPRTDRLLLAINREFYATFHRDNAFRKNGDRKGRNIRRHS